MVDTRSTDYPLGENAGGSQTRSLLDDAGNELVPRALEGLATALGTART